MQRGGNFAPPFADPDALVTVMRNRMQNLIDGAMEKGSAYFRQRMILDTPNLVNESLTSQTVTVLESFRHIDHYLEKLTKRFTDNPGEVSIVPSLIDTRRRLNKIIRSYDRINVINAEFQAMIKAKGMNVSPEEMQEFQKKTAEAYGSVIEAAYNEFNVLLQRDSFLTTRISTLVRYDFADRIRRRENMDEYQRQLLIVTGKNLLNKLVEVNQMNPQATEIDLNQAQVLNIRNLQAVESLITDSLQEAISSINRVIGGMAVRTVGFGFHLGSVFDLFPPKTQVARGVFETLYFTPVVPLKDRDDEYASFEQFKAKLCIQALAFYGAYKFEPLCRGAVLKSRYEPKRSEAEAAGTMSLSSSFDELLVSRYDNARKKGDATKRSDGVCALRNYLRKNYAYWLTKSFSLGSTGSAPISTPAAPSATP
jgi:hypothetical protein